jgi:MYXO-CTERM domain-containing protein
MRRRSQPVQRGLWEGRGGDAFASGENTIPRHLEGRLVAPNLASPVWEDEPTSTPTRTPTDTPAPIGAGCSEDADCDSGFCVDGVCCDTACNAVGEACNFPLDVGTCVVVPTAVPATSSSNLLYAAALLLAVAALALRRSQRRG